MNERGRAIFRFAQVGAKLRKMRESAGLTLDEAAPKLDKSKSSLHRVETGKIRPDVHIVRSMMDLYNIRDIDLLDEVRQAGKPPWYRVFGVQRRYHLDVETDATKVQVFSPLFLPDLLQTEQYALAYLRGHYPDSVMDEVEIQQIRQQRLTGVDPNPLQLVAIIGEVALDQAIGEIDLLRLQLKALIELSATPFVELRVLPSEEGNLRAAGSAFTLYTLKGKERPSILHIDHVAGATYFGDQDNVDRACGAFDFIREKALNSRDSLSLIDQRLKSNR